MQINNEFAQIYVYVITAYYIYYKRWVAIFLLFSF